MAKRPLVFKPENSKRARYLQSLSQRDLFNRYFVRTNKDQNFLQDFNNELARTDVNGNYVNLFTVSLVGEPLSYIPSLVNYKFAAFIPANYKINGTVLCQDMEAMLKENPAETKKAAMTEEATNYIVDMGDFLVERINFGLDHYIGHSI